MHSSELSLIGDREGQADWTAFSWVDNGTVALIPLRRPSQVSVWILTVVLAAIATPFFWFIFRTMNLDSLPDDTPFPMRWTPVIAWFFAVFGPVASYYIVPAGPFNPDHWLRIDRGNGSLSILGGQTKTSVESVVEILAVSGWKSRHSGRETELQVVLSHENSQRTRILVLTSGRWDPYLAFGDIPEILSRILGKPVRYVTLDKDGKIESEKTV